MSHDVLLAAEPVPVDVAPADPAHELAPEPAIAEPAVETEGPAVEKSVEQRAAMLAAVRSARDLPPGVRERLTSLVQQASTLDLAGDPLLSTRQVLELLAQGLPPVLRRETSTAIDRPEHPVGDLFFAANRDELSDQQAEQIARQQLQRAGLLHAA